MAKKKATPKQSTGVLVTAAKTLGEAAGRIAAAVGVTLPAEPKVQPPAKKKPVKKKSSSAAPRKKTARKSVQGK